MRTRPVTIDLATIRPDGAFVLVLVEQGPWNDDDITSNLRRLQKRLYDYVDIAVDGHLAKLYPEADGKSVWLRLDCYDTPNEPVRLFLQRFEECLRSSDAYQDAAVSLATLHFEYHWRPLNEKGKADVICGHELE